MRKSVICEVCKSTIRWYTGPTKPGARIVCADCGGYTAGREIARPVGGDWRQWENDESGASGSWDAAVKRYEGD